MLRSMSTASSLNPAALIKMLLLQTRKLGQLVLAFSVLLYKKGTDTDLSQPLVLVLK